MKWEDVSKRVPGRSPTSCRLHYQNYLERRTPWDDEKKNKLARLYERYVQLFLILDPLSGVRDAASGLRFLQARDLLPPSRYRQTLL